MPVLPMCYPEPGPMKEKLTDTLAAAFVLRTGETDALLWDSVVPGFCLRVRPGGKSWFLSYRPPGRGRAANTKKMKLASLDAVPKVSDARKLALIVLGDIARGADPLAERAKLKVKDRSKLGDLLDRYERDLERRRYVNCKSVMSSLRIRMGRLLSRDVTTITGAEYASIIDSIVSQGRLGAADDFRKRSRAFLTWCVADAKVLVVNPLAGHRKQRATRADKLSKEMKGRALSDAELVKLWHATNLHTAVGRLIRFLILTGCRRGEGAGLTWAMVEELTEVLNLPAIFTKQGRGHIAPIAPQLRTVLDLCPQDARSNLVFPSIRTGQEINGWTKLVDSLRKESGVDFCLHDLRRTFRTGLSRLGIDPDTAELALGHAREDLEAIYNRDDAIPKIRAAFEAWSSHVSALVNRPAELKAVA
ncbi:tyrosine-type recombinase/integrase [Methylobacterium sp. WL9]|nr:tyrosine-type recombinase/integrase [Methylobacterium sp. WL9]